jgi:hypothetical protein
MALWATTLVLVAGRALPRKWLMRDFMMRLITVCVMLGLVGLTLMDVSYVIAHLWGWVVFCTLVVIGVLWLVRWAGRDSGPMEVPRTVKPPIDGVQARNVASPSSTIPVPGHRLRATPVMGYGHTSPAGFAITVIGITRSRPTISPRCSSAQIHLFGMQLRPSGYRARCRPDRRVGVRLSCARQVVTLPSPWNSRPHARRGLHTYAYSATSVNALICR